MDRMEQDALHERSEHELNFWKAWLHIRRWKKQNHEAEKELHVQNEAKMLAFRRVAQHKLLGKSFVKMAQATFVLPPDPVDSSSDDEPPKQPYLVDSSSDDSDDSDVSFHDCNMDSVLAQVGFS